MFAPGARRRGGGKTWGEIHQGNHHHQRWLSTCDGLGPDNCIDNGKREQILVFGGRVADQCIHQAYWGREDGINGTAASKTRVAAQSRGPGSIHHKVTYLQPPYACGCVTYAGRLLLDKRLSS